MTRIRLRYVQAWVDGDGRAHHYFRRPGYPRVRLPGLPGSPGFMRAYEAALDGPAFPIGVAKRSTPGSVSMAVAAYYGSPGFAALAPRTKQMRRAIYEQFRNEHGDKPIALLPAEVHRADVDEDETLRGTQLPEGTASAVTVCHCPGVARR